MNEEIIMSAGTYIYPDIGDKCFINSFDSDEKLEVEMLKYVRSYKISNWVRKVINFTFSTQMT